MIPAAAAVWVHTDTHIHMRTIWKMYDNNTRSRSPPATDEYNGQWAKMSHRNVILPPGEYYIGDICYVMNDDTYHNVWGSMFGHVDGYYTNGTKSFVVAGTSYGDGEYKGTNGFNYSVDSGTIGIVSANLFDNEKDYGGLGTIHTFTKPVEVNMSIRGVFIFDTEAFHLRINTDGEDEEGEEEDGEEEEEDEEEECSDTED